MTAQNGTGGRHRDGRCGVPSTGVRVPCGLVPVSCLAVLLCMLLASIAPTRLPAQRAPAGARSRDTTLYTVSAATLRSVLEEGRRVTYLEGGVTVLHRAAVITSGRGKHYEDMRYTLLLDGVHGRDGTLELWGESGEYYGESNILTVAGNVRMVDQGWRITCDRARYDRGRRIAILTGNLKLSDSTRVMYADSIYYDRDADTADAFGNVVLIDEVEDYSIAGRHALFDRVKKTAVVDDRPILTYDLRAQEVGIISSTLMYFHVEDEIGVATGDVKMNKGETHAECDSALVRNNEMLIELYGEPRAYNGTSGMTGRTMRIRYNERGVEQVVITDDGRLTEKPPPGSSWREDSWIEGDSIIIHINEERVDSVGIIGNSRAMYYPVEGDMKKVSNNFSTGDTMFFRFRGRELSYVRIAGKSTGVYNFLNLAAAETVDSLAASIDTALVYRNFTTRAERIRYSADVIEYYADTEDLKLDGHAALAYQNKKLSANRIDFNSRLNILEASGDPVLEEDDQKMYGLVMGYDMESEAGLVAEGSTRYEQGFYRGKNIYKVGKDILKVYNSVYTTCENNRPHYSFRSGRMKVYLKDKIVSGPITMYLGEVPIFYLPFMANSLRRDRHSGIMRPNFDIGIDSRDGRFIRGLGYYWATNDYTDFTVTTDFNERQNFRVFMKNRYKVRYVLDGDVQFNYLRNLAADGNEWTFKSNHRQSFGKNTSLNSGLSFVSSDRAQSAVNSAEDVKRFQDRRIDSRVNFSKRWRGTSLGLAGSRFQKLNVTSPTENRVTATLPSLSLRLPRTSLWFGTKHKSGEQGLWERVLSGFTFSPNLSASRKTEESEARELATLSANSSTGFGRQLKLMFVNLSPSVNMGWNYFKVLHDRIHPDYAGQITKRGDYRNDFSMSLSSGVGTTLYGIFYPKIGPLLGIRHTFNPTATYSYTPKISERQVERQSVSYSIKNIVEVKLKKGENETNQKVFTWDLNGNFDPKSDLDFQRPGDQHFSNITSSLYTSIGSLISFRLNNTYDPYEREILSTSVNTGLTLRLSGSFAYAGEWDAREVEKIAAARDETGAEPADGRAGERENVPPADRGDVGSAATPDVQPAERDDVQPIDPDAPLRPGDKQSWSLNLNYSLSRTGSGDMQRINSQLDLTSNINLTRNWKVSYSAYYDLEAGEFTSQMYSIKRDLHCWQASFVYRQYGDEWSYYFQIAIKAHPEIMYERGARGLQSGFAF
ncbi:MAG TPA: putative LPS assembly protein LptD [Patescibacteria group bacterium]|nr:putative LPS assembly protein LptD [Patescibacteria group bacterium]